MFFPKNKKTSAPPQKPHTETALDRQQADLFERKKQLERQEEQLQALIQSAPRLREEQARRRQEARVPDRRLNPNRHILSDRRYELLHTADPTDPRINHRPIGDRPLRREKRDGKRLFLFLLLTLLGLLYAIWQSLAEHFFR